MKPPNYSCPQCGKAYYRYPSSVKKNRDIVCSRICAARYFRDKGQWINCPICQKQFWQTKSLKEKGYANYCSHECWGSTRKTPEGSNKNKWTKEQKQEWLGPKCIRCDATERLELDHIVATSLGGQSTKENSQTLCKRCNNRKFQLEDLPNFLSQKKTH